MPHDSVYSVIYIQYWHFYFIFCIGQSTINCICGYYTGVIPVRVLINTRLRGLFYSIPIGDTWHDIVGTSSTLEDYELGEKRSYLRRKLQRQSAKILRLQVEIWATADVPFKVISKWGRIANQAGVLNTNVRNCNSQVTDNNWPMEELPTALEHAWGLVSIKQLKARSVLSCSWWWHRAARAFWQVYGAVYKKKIIINTLLSWEPSTDSRWGNLWERREGEEKGNVEKVFAQEEHPVAGSLGSHVSNSCWMLKSVYRSLIEIVAHEKIVCQS